MKYVFDSKNSKRYAFPTHSNDLIIDRADASASEVFIVIVEPGKAVHLHSHEDVEQIFYILEGDGILTIGEAKDEIEVHPTNVVKIPPKTLHTIRAKSDKEIRYLCVDCFCSQQKVKEPTWDSHVKVMCNEQGYKFEDIIKFQK